MGATIAFLGVAYIQQNISFAIGFCVPLASMVMAVFSVIVIKSQCRRKPPSGKESRWFRKWMMVVSLFNVIHRHVQHYFRFIVADNIWPVSNRFTLILVAELVNCCQKHDMWCWRNRKRLQSSNVCPFDNTAVVGNGKVRSVNRLTTPVGWL